MAKYKLDGKTTDQHKLKAAGKTPLKAKGADKMAKAVTKRSTK